MKKKLREKRRFLLPIVIIGLYITNSIYGFWLSFAADFSWFEATISFLLSSIYLIFWMSYIWINNSNKFSLLFSLVYWGLTVIVAIVGLLDMATESIAFFTLPFMLPIVGFSFLLPYNMWFILSLVIIPFLLSGYFFHKHKKTENI